MTGSTTRPETQARDTAAPRPIDRLPRGLLTLWFATAVALVIAPFLTAFSTTTSAEGVDPHVISTDGWGRLESVTLEAHQTRLGVLLVVVAALLIVAGVAMLAARRSSWPLHLGLLASGMVIAAGVLHALEIESASAGELAERHGLTVEVSLGAGTWLTWIACGTAAVAAVLSWRHGQLLRRRTSPTYVMAGRAAERPPVLLLSLWLAMVAGLTLVPFLTSWRSTYRTEEVDPYVVEADGWGRVDPGAAADHDARIGVLGVAIAAALIVVVVATLVQRATWSYQLGQLAAAMTIGTGAYQLLRIDSFLSAEADDEALDMSMGAGSWLLAGVAGLAVAAIVLTLVHTQRQRP